MAGANCLWTFFTFKLTSHGHLLKINIADGKHLCSLLRFRVNVNLRISLGLFVCSEKKNYGAARLCGKKRRNEQII